MYTDIRYEAGDGIATITISRPEVLNAVRPLTVEELIEAFHEAWADRSIGVVILTGAGEKAFCVGGDATARADDGGYKSAPGQRPARSDLGVDMEDLHTAMRDIPKPVIAAVNGYAIGGGHVLHVLCDLTIAAEHARFGQVGPKVGSVDPGFGTAYLARLVGEKRAREIWYLCRQYSAAEALQMGLVNAVVPAAQLMDETRSWAEELLERSPTALKLAKASFNAASEHIRGIAALGMTGLALYYDTEESAEGVRAFKEKRTPDFSKFRR
jgi:2-ketocyclohexanecarboxyl-CoA hydrolase